MIYEDFEISIEFSQYVSCNFTAAKVNEKEDGSCSFCRVEDGEVMSLHGLFTVSNDAKKVDLSYDAFHLVADVVDKQENGDATTYLCAAGELKFQVVLSKL